MLITQERCGSGCSHLVGSAGIPTTEHGTAEWDVTAAWLVPAHSWCDSQTSHWVKDKHSHARPRHVSCYVQTVWLNHVRNRNGVEGQALCKTSGLKEELCILSRVKRVSENTCIRTCACMHTDAHAPACQNLEVMGVFLLICVICISGRHTKSTQQPLWHSFLFLLFIF